MKKLFTLLSGIALFFGSLFSQPTDRSKIDSYFQSLSTNDKFMGSVAISRNRKIIYSTAIGFKDRAAKAAANEETKYRIGSISKTFTAVLTFKSVEEGKLKLDQPLAIYFPSLKNADKITINNLLYHRSGIPNFTNNPDYLMWNTQPKSELEMVAIISKLGSDFEPDGKSAYSNSNYVLLSYILSRAYKLPFAKILEDKIISPLKLKNTYCGGRITSANNECYSYRYATDWSKEPETDMSIPMGAGSIVSTPTDIILFIEALFNEELISKISLTQMKTLKDKFGMGLFQIPFYDKIGFGHTGGIDGFSSVVSYFPRRQNCVCTNLKWFEL
jgi:D-alanyl-D-alanine carboxypeptidase